MAKNKPNKFNSKEYSITSPLSIADKGFLIKSIAQAVFNDSGYAPYMFDVAYKINCVVCYTDIELPKVKDEDENGNEPIDIEKAYQLIEQSEIMKSLSNVIDEDIYFSAQELIEYRKAEYLKNSKADELVEALTEFVKRLDTAVENGFGDIDVKEILDVSKSVASKDEGELAKAILDFEEAKAERAKGKSE